MYISVVIPTYNHADLLPRTLDAVCRQVAHECEIIVVDDGSTDNTADTVEHYAAQSPVTVRYLHQTNSGPARARNYGAAEAKGDWILFLDADDELLDGAFGKFRQASEENPQAALIIGGHISVYPDHAQTHLARPYSLDREQNFRDFLSKKHISISHGSALLHRRVVKHLNYPENLQNCEDLVLFAQIFALYDAVSFPDPVIRIHKYDTSRREDIDKKLREPVTEIVNALFNPKILSPSLMRMEREFHSRRYLSIFRACFRGKRYMEAQKMYHRALAIYPFHLFRLGYLGKYLRMQTKRLLRS